MRVFSRLGQRAEEDSAGGLRSKEDRAQTGCPGDHGGNRPSGLQCRRVKHPLAGEAAHEGNAHHAAHAYQP